jgi:hypothetical protein
MPPTTQSPRTKTPAGRKSSTWLWVAGVLTALVLAGFVSYYASASPDGLQKVAADHGMDKTTRDHAAKDSPLSGYRAKEVDDPRLSKGLAGVIGIGATLGVGSALFRVVRRRTPAQPTAGSESQPVSPSGARTASRTEEG